MRQPSMKLLWVFSSFGLGAAQNRFAALADQLGDEYEHVICAMDGDFEAARLIPDSVRWRKLAFDSKRASLISLGNLWSIRKILARERPAILLTQNQRALEWLLANRGPGAAPHVHFEDAVGQEELLDAADSAAAWARRRAFPGKNRLFVSSSREIAAAMHARWGAPADAVRHIPLGLDLAPFREIERLAPTDGDVTTLGVVGPLTKRKRVDRALRMTATLLERGREVRLLVFGEGPDRARLEAEARSLGLGERARFLGATADMGAAMAALDLLVAAADRDHSPQAVIAAMAAGLPVVGADVGEIGEILDPANALFVRPTSDESAMTAAAELLIADPGVRRAIGAANRARAVERHDVDVMARRYKTLFQEVTGETGVLMLPAPDAAASRPAEVTVQPGATDARAALEAARRALGPNGRARDADAPKRLERPHGWGAAADERATGRVAAEPTLRERSVKESRSDVA